MLESTDKLRRYISAFIPGECEADLLGIADEIEREIAELQENWAQEAREHADDSARLAELAHENAELKCEIAERYMELPVDRKNEPWHIGDKFAFGDGSGRKRICTVSGVSENEVFFYYDNNPDSTKHRHFNARALLCCKQRTIEDVLEEFLIEFDDWDWNTGGNDRDNARKHLFAKYADELRNMGVGE